MTNVYDQMASDLADGTPKILAALDRLAANGMPFATMASTSTVVVQFGASRGKTEQLTASLLDFGLGAARAKGRVEEFAKAYMRMCARLRTGRLWATGPRRGLSMRQRSRHLRARRSL